MCSAQGTIQLALRIPIGDNSTSKLQSTSFLKLGSHYFAKLVLSEFHWIDATDRQIDKLVYELYELTPEEIAIVESN